MELFNKAKKEEDILNWPFLDLRGSGWEIDSSFLYICFCFWAIPDSPQGSPWPCTQITSGGACRTIWETGIKPGPQLTRHKHYSLYTISLAQSKYYFYSFINMFEPHLIAPFRSQPKLLRFASAGIHLISTLIVRRIGWQLTLCVHRRKILCSAASTIDRVKVVLFIVFSNCKLPTVQLSLWTASFSICHQSGYLTSEPEFWVYSVHYLMYTLITVKLANVPLYLGYL